MKQKKFDKKLFLNKKTIVDLDNGEMTQVKGGSGDSRCWICPYTTKCVSAPMTNCTNC